MEPGEKLWHKYLDEIRLLKERKEITEEEVHVLLATQQARNELTNITKGDFNLYTEGTPQQILERMKQNVREEALAEAEKQRNLRVVAENELAGAKVKSEIKQKAQDEKIENLANTIASWATRVLYIIIIFLVVLGGFSSWLNVQDNIIKYFLIILSASFIILSIVSILVNITVKSWIDTLRKHIAKTVVKTIKRTFLPSE
jgi:hypothetical protein